MFKSSVLFDPYVAEGAPPPGARFVPWSTPRIRGFHTPGFRSVDRTEWPYERPVGASATWQTVEAASGVRPVLSRGVLSRGVLAPPERAAMVVPRLVLVTGRGSHRRPVREMSVDGRAPPTPIFRARARRAPYRCRALRRLTDGAPYLGVRRSRGRSEYAATFRSSLAMDDHPREPEWPAPAR
jgi:hypothetical protein